MCRIFYQVGSSIRGCAVCQERYDHTPVLIETFVQGDRLQGFSRILAGDKLTFERRPGALEARRLRAMLGAAEVRRSGTCAAHQAGQVRGCDIPLCRGG